MNAAKSHILTHTISSLIIGICLFLIGAADASAHEIDFRPYAVQRHYAPGQSGVLPDWLRGNREFQRWHLNSRYRSTRCLSWQRLYNIYSFEKRYRLQHRKFHGKVYRDCGYRNYRKKSVERYH